MMAYDTEFDERHSLIIRRVFATLYVFSLTYLAADILVRGPIWHQPFAEYADIAILLGLNALIAMPMIFLRGGISLGTGAGRFRWFLIAYLAALATGITYAVIDNRFSNWEEIARSILITAIICFGVIVLWIAFAWIGNRKINRQIGDD